MTFSIEAEAAALVAALRRVDCTADDVMGLSLLDRLLAASIAGVENPTDAHWVNPTDAHWVLVRKLFQAEETRA